jgi:hypothetical protein
VKGKEMFLHHTNEKDPEWEEKGLREAARNDYVMTGQQW